MRKYITNEVYDANVNKKNILTRELAKYYDVLNFELSPDEWKKLQELVEEKKAKIRTEVAETHRNKLIDLGIEENINIPSKNINMQRNKINTKETIINSNTIFNFSKRELTTTETSVLNKGLKFGIKNKKIDSFEIISRFEELAKSLDKVEHKPVISKDPLRANLNNKGTFIQQLQQMTYEFVELSKKAMDSLSDEEHKALLNLSRDKAIVISKADKGNAVVIQDVETYQNKIMELLNQDGKFKTSLFQCQIAFLLH